MLSTLSHSAPCSLVLFCLSHPPNAATDTNRLQSEKTIYKSVFKKKGKALKANKVHSSPKYLSFLFEIIFVSLLYFLTLNISRATPNLQYITNTLSTFFYGTVRGTESLWLRYEVGDVFCNMSRNTLPCGTDTVPLVCEDCSAALTRILYFYAWHWNSNILGVKRPEREVNYSLPYSAMVKNAWRYTSTPPPPNTSSWRGACLSTATIFMGWVCPSVRILYLR